MDINLPLLGAACTRRSHSGKKGDVGTALHGSAHVFGSSPRVPVCSQRPWEIRRHWGNLMALLSPSPSHGPTPAAGRCAHNLPKPVQAVLGQPDHQLHALRRRRWRLLLPGKELRSHWTAGRVEEEDMGHLASMETEIQAAAPGCVQVAGTSLEHVLGPLKCLLRRVTLADLWYTRTETSGP